MLGGETIAQTGDRLTIPRCRFLRPKAIAAIASLDFVCYFAVVECVTFIAVSPPVGSIKTAKNFVRFDTVGVLDGPEEIVPQRSGA
jgi:hypothetical protein